MARDPLEWCVGFDWDDGNIDKNWIAHRVVWWECEEVFLNRPRLTFEDTAHSKTERRCDLLGQTNAGRLLFVSFTIRRDLIRPISARDMNARKKIPKFNSEDEEREFWSRQDSTEYIDWAKAKDQPLPRLKPTLRTIEISLPEFVIAELTRLANKRDVTYESLLKTFVVDRLQAELEAEKQRR